MHKRKSKPSLSISLCWMWLKIIVFEILSLHVSSQRISLEMKIEKKTITNLKQKRATRLIEKNLEDSTGVIRFVFLDEANAFQEISIKLGLVDDQRAFRKDC